MKSRKTRRSRSSTHNQQVRQEIRTFLRALNSYPESFSRRPGISFEQHHQRIVTSSKTRRSVAGS